MTHDAKNLSQDDLSVPLDEVLDRAFRGESITRGMGPFFLCFCWPYRIRVYPQPFDSVESALLYLGSRLVADPNYVEPGSWVVVCQKLGSKWVQ
jgi:hypothetical protein